MDILSGKKKMPRKKVDKPYCSGTLTKAGLMGKIRSCLRRMSLKWRPRTDYLKAIRRPYTGTDKRTKWEYECQHCKKWVKSKDYEVDHIIPCGSLTDWDEIGDFCKRLFIEVDGYRGLCKKCHLIETNKARGK